MSNPQGPEGGELGPFPFPRFDIPEDIYGSRTNEQLFRYILRWLRKNNLYKSGLLFTGFDAALILAKGSFGERNSTFANTEPHIRAEHENPKDDSVFDYAINGVKPAIAIFDSERMLGGTNAHYEIYGDRALGKVALKDFANPHYDFEYWKTADDSSLDSVTVAIVMLPY